MYKYLHSLITDERRGFLAGVFRALLFILSLAYGLIVRVLSFIYRIKPYRLKCRVVSVGNITLGGTGKTPFVEMLAQYLTGEGYKVAILTRGYGRKNSSVVVLCGGRLLEVGQGAAYEVAGDEPLFLSQSLPRVPILVGRDRIKSAKEALKRFAPDVLILDDGFQHWRLARDLDIVLLDATCPFGNGHLLPRGVLREPLSSLKRTSLILITKADLIEDDAVLTNLKEKIKLLNQKAEVFISAYEPKGLVDKDGNLHPASSICGIRVCAVSSIARPGSFEKKIADLGARIAVRFRFPDHYRYRPEDISEIINACQRENLEMIITTDKDLVRLRDFELPCKVLVLRIRMRLVDEADRFFNRLRSFLFS
jgi:tetraacyldisaccharide 4'-kinase